MRIVPSAYTFAGKVWRLVGVLAGLGAAYLYFTGHIKQYDLTRKGMSPIELVNLTRLGESNGHTRLIELLVYPAIDGRNYVTGRRFVRVQKGAPVYEAFEVAVPQPIVVRDAAGVEHTYKDVGYFMSSAGRNVSYNYVWWRGDSILIILIVVSLITGGGVLVPRAIAYVRSLHAIARGCRCPDLAPSSNTTSKSEGPVLAPVPDCNTGMSSLVSPVVGGGEPAEGTTPIAVQCDTPVQRLSQEPLEPIPANETRPVKSYAGEYYPVAKSDVDRPEA